MISADEAAEFARSAKIRAKKEVLDKVVEEYRREFDLICGLITLAANSGSWSTEVQVPRIAHLGIAEYLRYKGYCVTTLEESTYWGKATLHIGWAEE